MNFAVLSAYWDFVINKKAKTLADKGNVEAVTKRVNGGHNGLKKREAKYKKAKEVLTNPPSRKTPTKKK
jgi:putative chitinase